MAAMGSKVKVWTIWQKKLVKMTITTRPFQRSINQLFTINSSYTVNESRISVDYMQLSSMTQFWPTGLSLKKYYVKHTKDRTLIFAPILLIRNGVYVGRSFQKIILFYLYKKQRLKVDFDRLNKMIFLGVFPGKSM